MSTIPLSGDRKPLPATATLADLIAYTDTDPTLTTRLRHDRSSAIRRVTEAVGATLSTPLTERLMINRKLDGFTPATKHWSKAYWTTLKSHFRMAIRAAGLEQMPCHQTDPMTPEWAERFARLSHADQIGLSRPYRLFSSKGLRPGDVDDAAMAGLLEAMESGWVIRDQRQTFRTICRLWNATAAIDPAQVLQTVTVPAAKEKSYQLPWTTFPATLKQDIDSYIERLAGADLMVNHGFNPLAPETLVTRGYWARQIVAGYVHAGGKPEDLGTLADVVQLSAVNKIMQFCLSRSQGKRTVQMFQFAGFLTAIAKHWVKVDTDHFKELQALCKRLKPRSGMVDKNRALLRQFEESKNILAVIRLPEKMLREAKKCKQPSLRSALLVQTAVAIEILLMVPVRRKNLASLELERHIRTSKKGGMFLEINEEEVKNKMRIYAELPAESAKLITEYVAKFRPLLCGPNCKALFPGQAGNAKCGYGLGSQISKAVLHFTGLKMHPHFFRHFAAMHYLEGNPGAYGTLKLALAHKSVDTTSMIYCGGETKSAFRQLDQHVLRKRNSVEKASKPAARQSSKSTPTAMGR